MSDIDIAMSTTFKWMERRCKEPKVQELYVELAWIKLCSRHYACSLSIVTHAHSCLRQEFFLEVCTPDFLAKARKQRQDAEEFTLASHQCSFKTVLRLSQTTLPSVDFDLTVEEEGKNDYFFTIRADDPESNESLEEQAHCGFAGLFIF